MSSKRLACAIAFSVHVVLISQFAFTQDDNYAQLKKLALDSTRAQSLHDAVKADWGISVYTMKHIGISDAELKARRLTKNPVISRQANLAVDLFCARLSSRIESDVPLQWRETLKKRLSGVPDDSNSTPGVIDVRKELSQKTSITIPITGEMDIRNVFAGYSPDTLVFNAVDGKLYIAGLLGNDSTTPLYAIDIEKKIVLRTAELCGCRRYDNLRPNDQFRPQLHIVGSSKGISVFTNLVSITGVDYFELEPWKRVLTFSGFAPINSTEPEDGPDLIEEKLESEVKEDSPKPHSEK